MTTLATEVSAITAARDGSLCDHRGARRNLCDHRGARRKSLRSLRRATASSSLLAPRYGRRVTRKRRGRFFAVVRQYLSSYEAFATQRGLGRDRDYPQPEVLATLRSVRDATRARPRSRLSGIRGARNATKRSRRNADSASHSRFSDRGGLLRDLRQ